MPDYNCNSCNYLTIYKPNYLRHLKSRKHLIKKGELEVSLISESVLTKNEHKMNKNEQKGEKNEHKMNKNEHKLNKKEHFTYFCEYCLKTYKSYTHTHTLHTPHTRASKSPIVVSVCLPSSLVFVC